ncbi:phosphopentomutase [Paludibaculum fermentans]|uniref:Phosphopentomutase n=1 Tax=Paludibaculum fermentans TaxID=1473598 RepID=A0A7S7NXM0_PALFE|nr:phosphopentomutase [Paludibaculum fermentans]QOY91670.1 phosphopentomutase [Paludibaculum fermentans]
MAFRRIAWIVLDSVGIGAMPDWQAFGDDRAGDTLGHCASLRPLHLPNLCSLGLANIRPFDHLTAASAPRGSFGRCTLASPGKDTTTGHWEMVGIHLSKPFPLYPNGFPADLMAEFERRIGRGTLGNYAASGTEIIKQLGDEHLATGKPIVYTSADSVFQIAAHEGVIPIPEQYRICEIARALLTGPHEVGRVIARPFEGVSPNFTRTTNRHDYAVPPPEGMLLDQLSAHGVPVVSVGKIADIFLGRGVTRSLKTKTNADGMAKTLEALASIESGLVFVNLVDFDMLFGHRNDPEGYSKALEAVDAWVPQLEAALGPEDLVVLTADHGCDPTTPSTDHSREYVPLIAFGPKAQSGANLGTRGSLADIGQTVAENFGTSIKTGTSFLPSIR